MNKIPGVTIQQPWADMIVAGDKSIETRLYPLPQRYIGIPIAIIETPGRQRAFRRRIRGFVVFGASFQYASLEAFNSDFQRHLVPSEHPLFGWKVSSGKPKWGWPILQIVAYDQELPDEFKSGILFASTVPIEEIGRATIKSLSV